MKPQDFIYTLGVNLYVDEQAQTKLLRYRPRQALVNPVGIGLASYVAQLFSATSIVNGEWSAIVAGLPGTWEAVRSLVAR